MNKLAKFWLRAGMFWDSFEEIPCIFYSMGLLIIFTYAICDLICEIFDIKNASIGNIFWG